MAISVAIHHFHCRLCCHYPWPSFIYIYSSRAVPTILCFNLWAYHNIYIYTTERYTIAMNIVRYRDIQHVLLPNIPYSDNWIDTWWNTHPLSHCHDTGHGWLLSHSQWLGTLDGPNLDHIILYTSYTSYSTGICCQSTAVFQDLLQDLLRQQSCIGYTATPRSLQYRFLPIPDTGHQTWNSFTK